MAGAIISRPICQPQWSPPLTSGSSVGERGILAIWFKPRWSPPRTGGSTRHDLPHDRVQRHAAMEPAAERRKHTGTGVRAAGLPPAMEPAGDACGSTPTHTFTDVTNIVPQWSRGEEAAETGLVARAGEVEGLAAMEPACLQREYRDQGWRSSR